MRIKKLASTSIVAFVFTQGLISSSFAQNTAFRVTGIHGKVLLERSIPSSLQTLGRVSNDLITEAIVKKILSEYQGSENGVSSINHLGSAMEVLSNTEMNAYGWCYRVDGRTSELMADQYVLTGKEKQIEWFYAYAHVDKNVWTSMCVPANHQPPQQ